MPTSFDKELSDKLKKPYGTLYPDDGFFRTIFATPDFKRNDLRFKSSVILGGLAGGTIGHVKTVLSDVDILNLRLDNKRLVLSNIFRYGSVGVIAGAAYALVVQGSCKLRGNKDDPLNHFLGGFGVSSALALYRGQWKFILAGMLYGGMFATIKHLCLLEFNFFPLVMQQGHVISPSRYPEFYMVSANTKDLPRYEKKSD